MNVTKYQRTTRNRGLRGKKNTGYRHRICDKDRGTLSENTLVKSRLLDRPPSTAALAAVSLKGFFVRFTAARSLRHYPPTPGANVQNRLTGKKSSFTNTYVQSNANRISRAKLKHSYLRSNFVFSTRSPLPLCIYFFR